MTEGIEYGDGMARAKWCGDAVYEAAAEFKDRCLIEDDSLFSPRAGAWTPAHVGRVAARIGAPGSSAGSFIEKLEDQLGGLESEEVLIGAEILFMVLVPEADTGGAKRREQGVSLRGPSALRATLRARQGHAEGRSSLAVRLGP
jgi:hypothetical protein